MPNTTVECKPGHFVWRKGTYYSLKGSTVVIKPVIKGPYSAVYMDPIKGVTFIVSARVLPSYHGNRSVELSKNFLAQVNGQEPVFFVIEKIRHEAMNGITRLLGINNEQIMLLAEWELPSIELIIDVSIMDVSDGS